MPIRIIDNAVYSGTITVGGNATFAGRGIFSDNVQIVYTGSKTNDAGLYIENDASDWGIHVNKNTNNFGVRITSDGGNAFGIYSDAGVNKINLSGTGNATFAGNVDIDGGTLNVGSSNQVNIVASGFSSFPSLKVNNSGYLGSASVPTQIQLLSSGNTTFAGDLLLRGTYNPYAQANRGNITLNGSNTNIIAFTNNTVAKGYIYHNGTDLEILNIGTGVLKFAAGNAEKMRITSAGNVGIGTTGPYTKLSVVKDITTTAEFGSFGQFTIQGATNASKILSFGFNTATDVGFIQAMINGTSYNDLLLNARGGNVGIGTTSPAAKLHIKTSVDNSVSQGLVIERSVNSDRGYINYNGGGFQFRSTVGDPIVFGETDAEHMRILPDGNVGIGTTNPGAKLDIEGNNGVSANGQKVLELTDNIGWATIGSGPKIVFKRKDLDFDLAAIRSYVFGTNLTGLAFDTGHNALTTKMVIDNAGNVGIGEVDPQQKLHIRSTTAGPTGIIIENTNNSQSLDLEFWNNVGSAQGRIRYNEGAGSFDFSTNVGVGPAMTMLYNGNVGIGTTSPFTNATNTGLNIDTGGHSSLLIGDGVNTGGMIQSSDNSQRIIIGANAYDSPTASWSRWNAAGAALVDVYAENDEAFISLNVDAASSGYPAPRLTVSNAGAIKFNAYGAGTLVSDASGNITVSSGGGAGGPYLPLSAGSSYPLTGELAANAGVRIKGRTVPTSGNGLEIFYYSPSDVFYLEAYDYTTNNYKDIRYAGLSHQFIAGNVGIGTTNPSQKLHVVGKGLFTDDIQLNQTSPRIDYGNTTTAGSLRFWSTNAGGEKMRITSAGNVGIGDSNPVNGYLTIRGATTTGTKNGHIMLTGDSATNGQGPQIVFSESGVSSNFAGASVGYLRTGSNGIGDLVFGTREIAGDADTAPTERMRIDSAGNVGIGTSNINFSNGGGLVIGSVGASRLKIANATTGYGATDGLELIQSGVDSYIFNYEAGPMYFGTSSSTRITITSSGNVGIGTTNPSAKLDINGGNLGFTQYNYLPSQLIYAYNGNSESVEMGSIRTSAGSDWTSAGFRIQEKIDSTWMGYVQFNGDGNNGGISFGTGLSSSSRQAISERMRITSTGNVGIGTTSPARQLEVSNTGNAIVRIAGDSDNDVGETGDAVLEMTTDAGGHGWSIRSANIGGGTGDFKVNTFINSVESTKLLIDRDGNVGIGTTNPGAKLQVYSTAKRDISIFGHGTQAQNTWQAEHAFFTSAGQGVVVGKSNAENDTNRLHILYNTSNGDAEYLGYDTSSTNKVRLNTNGDSFLNGGNVGIGTTNPSTKLDVQGGYIKTRDGDQTAFIQGGNTYAYFGNLNGGIAAFGNSDNYTTLVADGGNVGIGTTDPDVKLHIQGPDGAVNPSNYSVLDVAIENSGQADLGIIGTTYSSIYFGDAATVLAGAIAYAHADNHMSFRTNGNSEKMRITSSGNVGIGTTNPGYKLDVGGNARVQTDLSVGVSGAGDINWSNFTYGSYLQINNNQNALRIRNSANTVMLEVNGVSNYFTGNVGIGTTNPEVKLQVEGSVQANLQGRFKGWYTSGSGLALETGVSGGDGYVLTYDRDNSAYSSTIIESTGIQFVTHASGKFYFTGGNVGIGTTSPATKLQVDGVIRSKGTSANIDVDSLYGAFRFNNGTTFTGGFYNDAVLSSGNAVDLVTYIASGDYYISTVSASKAVTVKQGGNVGIGTTSPATKLDVDGEITVSDTANFNGGVIAQALPQYADNNAALLAGEPLGTIYYTNVSGDGILKVVI